MSDITVSPNTIPATVLAAKPESITGVKRDRYEGDSSCESRTTQEFSESEDNICAKGRRLEPSTTLRNESELRSFLSGEHPMLRPGKSAEDFSAVLIVHSQWNKPRFSIPETVHRYGNLTTTFQMTALPSLSVFCLDVDAIGVEETCEILQLVTYPLPALLMYRFTSQSRSDAGTPLAPPLPKLKATKVVEKSLYDQRNDEEAILKAIRSASLVEPVHDLAHLQNRLEMQPDGTYTIVLYSASWCPPCRRVAESMSEIITRIPNNCVQIVKADKDQTQGLYDHFGVQKIPTFQIFKNGSEDAKPGFTPKGSLQNSQATQVIGFIDQNCATLKFGFDDDEDF